MWHHSFLIFSSLLIFASLAGGQISEDRQISQDQLRFVKKYESHKKLVPPQEALLNNDPEPDLNAGFVDLYNGKDLSDWTARGGDCTFVAQGEVIIGTCLPGSPSTYLSTKREDFENFILTAELKWVVDGNSGIMFRAQRKPGKKVESVFGPQAEMEGFSFNRGWSGGLFAQSDGGWIYPLWLEAHQEVRGALKKEAWNRITVQAIGNEFKTWVNGLPAAAWVDAQGEYSKGFIGLQIHSGKQGEVHFRKIRIKEIESEWTDLFSSGDFSAWTHVNGNPVPAQWILENGVLHLAKPGAGDIITKQHYQDFELRFDWKISEAGNSGIKYRTRGQRGLEYQVLDDEKHKDGKIPSHRTGSLYDLVEAAPEKLVNPPGQWNSGRILAKGNKIEHWLNGKRVVAIEIGSEDWAERFQKSKYKKHDGFGTWTGPILLQDHLDKVWYRNIQIREL